MRTILIAKLSRLFIAYFNITDAYVLARDLEISAKKLLVLLRN